MTAPEGPASTAMWVALPARYWDQDQNHSVQPSSHLPAFALLVIVFARDLPGGLWGLVAGRLQRGRP